MAFLINYDGTDQETNGSGSVILEANINTNYLKTNPNRLRPYFTSSAWEVSKSLSVGNIDYHAIANRLTGSDFTQEDKELQKAEIFLTVAHFSVPGNLRFTDRGGNATSTGYKDSLNALSTHKQAKEIQQYYRNEANRFIRRAINQKILAVSSSNYNVQGGLGYAIENPSYPSGSE